MLFYNYYQTQNIQQYIIKEKKLLLCLLISGIILVEDNTLYNII